MPKAWRIVATARAATSFDGTGARKHGGRWNSAGLSVVYAAGSRALAALEILVHLPKPAPPIQFRIIEVEIPANEIEIVADPAVLRAVASASILKPTQRFGDIWLTEARTVALQVPSSVIPEEPNFLINPEHPRFGSMSLGTATDFAFDPRLISLR